MSVDNNIFYRIYILLNFLFVPYSDHGAKLKGNERVKKRLHAGNPPPDGYLLIVRIVTGDHHVYCLIIQYSPSSSSSHLQIKLMHLEQVGLVITN